METEILKQIDQQLEVTGIALKWVDQFLKGERREESYEKVMKIRRSLKKVKYALQENPAAAMYGESQVGKSYLISGLLSESGDSYSVMDGCQRYDFLKQINPVGDGKESTSLVCRFSTNVNLENPGYPIKAKLLSVRDLILVLCDSYYNDVHNQQFLKEADINEKVDKIRAKFENHKSVQQYIEEDDLLEMRDYLKKHFKSLTRDICDSDFFKVIPGLIPAVPVDGWTEVFKILWNENRFISDCFSTLVKEYRKIDFSKIVYIQIGAVLRNYGTLLNVTRLDGVLGEVNTKDAEEEYHSEAQIYYKIGEQECERNFPKTVLCALVSEIVFKVGKELVKKKPFLEKMDLLDFPGARARLELSEREIGDSNLKEMLLRGKVAYLFNKFSESFFINNLLLCHHGKQTGQRVMPKLLWDWVCTFVGESPAERKTFIEKSKISPLFLISTMFNLDMAINPVNDTIDRPSKDRWERRFVHTIGRELIAEEDHPWFNQWVGKGPGEQFKNMFLLRDFNYTRQAGIFRLADTRNSQGEHVQEEQLNGDYERFVPALEKSFKEQEFVRQHFEDVDIAWNAVATGGNDGTQLIIDKLSVAGENAAFAREEKFLKDIRAWNQELFNELKKYYHTDKADENLKEAIGKAGRIQMELDTTFGMDPYFFGKLMQRFLLKESYVFNYYMAKINDIELIEKADLSRYVALRLANPAVSPEKSYEENMAVLEENYTKNTGELEKYFTEQGINLNELFYGDLNRLKRNSQVLAEGLQEKWFEDYLNEERFKDFVRLGFTSDSLCDLLDNIKVLYHKLQVTKRLEEGIRRYVDTVAKIDEVQEMIADISAEIINKFINTLGYCYYSADMLRSIEKANTENNLNLVVNHDYLTFSALNKKDITDLFITLDNLTEILNRTPLDRNAIRNLPNFSNYTRWKDLMKISFVAMCDIPTYDRFANNELKSIMARVEQIEEKFKVV